MTDLKTIKSVSIIDIAKDLYGLSVVRAGNRYYSLKEMDSVRIRKDGLYFWRNSNTETQGSPIDFVVHMETLATGKCSTRDAIRKIEQYIGLNPDKEFVKREIVIEKAEFIEPEEADECRSVFGYLCNERKISYTVMKNMVKRKYVYQEKRYRNAVFASYDKDGKMTYAQRCRTARNVPSKKRRWDVEGGDMTLCWRVENNSHTLVVCEAVIDSLSYMTLCELEGINFNSFDYLATNGTNKIRSVLRAVSENAYSRIILCYDNDEAGQIAFQSTTDLLREFGYAGLIINKTPHDEGSDINDLLIKTLKENGLC